MDNILELNNVSKRYHDSKFELNNISFSIPYGSIMGLVGENGSGKTTLIRLILDTLKRESGEIKLFGKEISDCDISTKEQLGVVFDHSSFPGYLTAESLAKVLKNIYRKWNQGKFDELLKRFQLSSDSQIKTLSKGMSKKLAIAAVLSHEPSLLILDEVTNGLDPAARSEMNDIFLEFLENEQHSILLCTHITNDLEQIADHITFIHQGKLLLQKPTTDLLYNYGVMRCKKEIFPHIDKSDYLAFRHRDFQTDVLVADKRKCILKYPDTIIDNSFIDEMLSIMIRGNLE